MNKIPVFHTVGQSYSFAFGKYLPLLGVLWLPMLVLGVLGYFAFVPFFEGFPALIQHLQQFKQAQHSNPSAMPSFPPEFFQMFRSIELSTLSQSSFSRSSPSASPRKRLGCGRGRVLSICRLDPPRCW